MPDFHRHDLSHPNTRWASATVVGRKRKEVLYEDANLMKHKHEA